MGLLTTVEPILGYVIGIAVIMLIAGLTFFSAASTNAVDAAKTMAQIVVLIGVLVGISVASKAAET